MTMGADRPSDQVRSRAGGSGCAPVRSGPPPMPRVPCTCVGRPLTGSVRYGTRHHEKESLQLSGVPGCRLGGRLPRDGRGGTRTLRPMGETRRLGPARGGPGHDERVPHARGGGRAGPRYLAADALPRRWPGRHGGGVFQYLAARAPFTDRALRAELLTRLNELEGVDTPGGKLELHPNFRLSVGEKDRNRELLAETLAWFRGCWEERGTVWAQEPGIGVAGLATGGARQVRLHLTAPSPIPSP